jgi:hypothetical protein
VDAVVVHDGPAVHEQTAAVVRREVKTVDAGGGHADESAEP